MAGPVLFVMAIMGCGEADTACEQVSVVPAAYSTLESCNAATDDMVARNSDVLYPVVVAQCRRADAKAAQIVGNAVDLPEPTVSERLKVRAASYASNSGARF